MLTYKLNQTARMGNKAKFKEIDFLDFNHVISQSIKGYKAP